MGIIEKLNAKGKTIILITHDSEVAEQTDKQIIIRDGLIMNRQVNL